VCSPAGTPSELNWPSRSVPNLSARALGVERDLRLPEGPRGFVCNDAPNSRHTLRLQRTGKEWTHHERKAQREAGWRLVIQMG